MLLEKEQIIFFEAHVLLNMQAFLDITDFRDCGHKSSKSTAMRI